jgi:hypothetical protein
MTRILIVDGFENQSLRLHPFVTQIQNHSQKNLTTNSFCFRSPASLTLGASLVRFYLIPEIRNYFSLETKAPTALKIEGQRTFS